MDERFAVDGLRVTVAGGARSGVAAAEALVRRGARVLVSEATDTVADRDRLAALGVRVETGGHRAEQFVEADLVVLSPGVPPERPFVAAARGAGVPVIGELELASRWLSGRIIAITGTKGKSTTATLTGDMLKASGLHALVGGNIGTPLSSQVDDSTPQTLHVVEASSFQLETTDRFHPWIAAVLNFSADHLDRHPTVDAYGAAKRRIFANQTAHDWAVVNADDDGAMRIASGARSRRRWFGFGPLDQGVTISNGVVVERNGEDAPLVSASVLAVSGRHILSDVMAAAAISRLAGARPDAIAAAAAAFRGLEHAMEIAGTVGGVRFINDSKATNMAAARRSIESVEHDVVVILGGRFKGGDFRELRPALEGRARAVVAIGEAQPLIVDALSDIVPVHVAPAFPEAVAEAFAVAQPDGTVVLAPACSSFDMFADYADRGRQFKREVRRLAERVSAGSEP